MTIPRDLKDIKWDIWKGHTSYTGIYTNRLIQWILSGGIKKGEVRVWRSGLAAHVPPENLPELKPYFDQWEAKQKRGRKRKVTIHRKKQIKSILVVDDEEDTCSLLKTLLAGYEVNTVTTGRGAINFVTQNKPDMVLLDLKLGDMDGLKVLSKIKKASPRSLVTMISAYGDENVKKEAKEYGAFSFLDKPLFKKKVFNIIKKAKV